MISFTGDRQFQAVERSEAGPAAASPWMRFLSKASAGWPIMAVIRCSGSVQIPEWGQPRRDRVGGDDRAGVQIELAMDLEAVDMITHGP